MSHTKLLKWLQEWYRCQCNGDWEHEFGVSVNRNTDATWAVKIDLSSTKLERKKFIEVNKEKLENDWFHCWVSENVFNGKGGPQNLIDIIEIFQKWTEISKNPISIRKQC